jgi:VWFA-related protein
MMRRAFVAVSLLASLSVSLSAGPQDAPAEPQTFRSTIDILQLDVSVLDSKRQPIRGLTAADFTVTEDGKPRKVETLVEINVPPAPEPAAAAVWRDKVDEDVFSTRTFENAKRVVVIVIDDNSLQRSQITDPKIVQKTREVSRAAVTDFGEGDLGAIVYASDRFSTQNLTSDRSRLLRSIARARLFPGSDSDAVDATGLTSGQCACNLCSVNVLTDVARALATMSNLRKTVLYVGAGINPPPPTALDCYDPYVRTLQRMYQEAALANVNVNTFDPTGLRATVGGAGRMMPDANFRTAVGIEPRIDFLRMIAEDTGGRAIVNTNDPELRVPEILAASRSYYLIGFQVANLTPDGKMRRLRVQVNRKGVTVEARKGYVVPRPDPAPRTAAATNVARVLPATAFPLEASAGVLAEVNGKAAAALTLGISRPAGVLSAGPTRVVARIVDPFGRTYGQFNRTLQFPQGSGSALKRYDVFAKLPIPPGSYEVRISVETSDGQTSGVHVPVDVPNFGKEELSTSSLVFSATPSPDSVEDRAVTELLPVVPTTRRVFEVGDSVTALLRVYQKERRQAPTVQIDVIDADGEIVASDDRVLSLEPYGSIYAGNCLFDVPVRRLQPGEYRLSMQVAAGEENLQRSVRFVVR